MSELGELVKGLRRGRALSQRALAAEAGVSVDSVVQIEAGREPRPATLRKLAKGLRVQVERLTGGIPEASGVSSGAVRGAESRALAFVAMRDPVSGEGGDPREAYGAMSEDYDREAYGEVLAASRLPLKEALARAQRAPLWMAGVRDEDEAELPPGGGLSDEVVAQRRARDY